MKEKEITVVKVEPMKQPVIDTLVNDLDHLQKAVSIGAGYGILLHIRKTPHFRPFYRLFRRF
jgi:hypothetical protein